MSLSLVVLAAGIGRRYGGLKQIDPVGQHDELIIDYSIFDAIRAGFDRCIFVVRPEIEADVRSVIGRRVSRHIECVYVHQVLDAGLPAGCRLPAGRIKPLGTAHATLACASVVNEPFAVINADDFYGADAFRQLAGFLRDSSSDSTDYAMVAYLLRNTLSAHGSVARGICVSSDDGRLQNVTEHTSIKAAAEAIESIDEHGNRHILDGNSLASMNCWGFTPSLFPALERTFKDFLGTLPDKPNAEFFLPAVINELLSAGNCSVSVLQTDAGWFGVTYPDDKPMVRERIRGMTEAGAYPAPLWQ